MSSYQLPKNLHKKCLSIARETIHIRYRKLFDRIKVSLLGSQKEGDNQNNPHKLYELHSTNRASPEQLLKKRKSETSRIDNPSSRKYKRQRLERNHPSTFFNLEEKTVGNSKPSLRLRTPTSFATPQVTTESQKYKYDSMDASNPLETTENIASSSYSMAEQKAFDLEDELASFPQPTEESSNTNHGMHLSQENVTGPSNATLLDSNLFTVLGKNVADSKPNFQLPMPPDDPTLMRINLFGRISTSANLFSESYPPQSQERFSDIKYEMPLGQGYLANHRDAFPAVCNQSMPMGPSFTDSMGSPPEIPLHARTQEFPTNPHRWQQPQRSSLPGPLSYETTGMTFDHQLLYLSIITGLAKCDIQRGYRLYQHAFDSILDLESCIRRSYNPMTARRIFSSVFSNPYIHSDLSTVSLARHGFFSPHHQLRDGQPTPFPHSQDLFRQDMQQESRLGSDEFMTSDNTFASNIPASPSTSSILGARSPNQFNSHSSLEPLTTHGLFASAPRHATPAVIFTQNLTS